jgi:hypothetical protein
MLIFDSLLELCLQNDHKKPFEKFEKFSFNILAKIHVIKHVNIASVFKRNSFSLDFANRAEMSFRLREQNKVVQRIQYFTVI